LIRKYEIENTSERLNCVAVYYHFIYKELIHYINQQFRRPDIALSGFVFMTSFKFLTLAITKNHYIVALLLSDRAL